jgi:[ribosomal protein S5]-alanine N-acetyltransferase
VQHVRVTLQTDRLLLRPMVATDAVPLLEVFGDARVMASFGVPPFDHEQMRRWVRRNLDHQRHHGYGLFTVVLRDGGRVIGDCGLERMEVEGEPVHELGYDLHADYWSRGLATEAAVAVRDWAFGSLGLPRLVALIRSGNAASRRVAEKCGMILDRTVDRGGHPYWVYCVDRP